jgi:hypothetical protein
MIYCEKARTVQSVRGSVSCRERSLPLQCPEWLRVPHRVQATPSLLTFQLYDEAVKKGKQVSRFVRTSCLMLYKEKAVGKKRRESVSVKVTTHVGTACVSCRQKKAVVPSSNGDIYVVWNHLAEKTCYKVDGTFMESLFANKVTIKVQFLFYITCLLVLWPSNI